MLEKIEDANGDVTYVLKSQSLQLPVLFVIFTALSLFSIVTGWLSYTAPAAQSRNQMLAILSMVNGGIVLMILLLIGSLALNTRLKGGTRLVLSRDRVILKKGDRSWWAAWNSIGPFERRQQIYGGRRRRMDLSLSALVTGPSVDQSAVRKYGDESCFYLRMMPAQQDMPMLARALNMQRAKAIGAPYDDSVAAALETQIQSQSKMGYKLIWFSGTLPVALVFWVVMFHLVSIQLHIHQAKFFAITALVVSLASAFWIAQMMGTKKYPNS
jgi:hypothetical protein